MTISKWLWAICVNRGLQELVKVRGDRQDLLSRLNKTVAEDLAERIQQVFSSRFAVKLCVTQINNSGAMFSYQ